MPAVIDCHAHAYPDASYQLERLAGRLSAGAADLVRDTVAPAARAARRAVRERAERLGRHIPRPMPREGGAPAFGIERLAAMRARSPGPARMLENAMSAIATPATVLAAGTVERLLASMDRHGIEETVVIGAPPVAQNDWLLDVVAATAGDRLVPFVTLPELDRDAGEEVFAEELSWLADRGARGFKIHPNMDRLHPDHPAYHAVFSVAADRDLPVILHTGCFDVAFYPTRGPAEPGDFEPHFSRHPDVRVCLAHMNREHPERAWEVMKRHGQLYTDTSWQPEAAVKAAIGAVGADRILLGSDWPLLHPGLQGDALDILRRAATDEEFEQIGQDSARRFLGGG
jgi:predicted TIM-barrel fold metal-dependent hydrolase